MTKHLRWLAPTLALVLAAGLVTGQAPPKPLPTGLVKSSPATGFTKAIPGTDYLAPNGSGAALTGVVHTADVPETIAGVKTFTSGPLVPTAAVGTNTTQAASTAFVLANGGGTSFDSGAGTVLTPVPGGTPTLTAGTGGGLTSVVYRTILSKDTLQTTDASYVEYDVSAFAPPGATAAVLDVSVLSAFAGSKIQIKPVNVGGPTAGAGAGINGDGSTQVLVQQAVYPICQQITVPLDANRRFLMKRTAFGDTYFGVNLAGWHGGKGLTVGGPTVWVAGDANNYCAWPNGWVVPGTGTRLLAYIGWDEVTSNDHVTGGAVWLKRNSAAPVKLMVAGQTGGSPLNEAWPFHDPSNPTRLIIVANRLIAGAYYVTSTDDGQTWSAPAALPAIAGAPGGHQIPYNFILSRDATKIYATFYDSALGSSVWLGQSSNGTTWTHRSNVNNNAVPFAGNETAIGYLPGGRLVAVIRNNNQFNPCGTCYSDDDGLTWTAVVTQTNAIHGHRPIIPLSGGAFACPGRYVNLTGHAGLCSFVFTRDGTQAWRTGAYTIAGLGESAYPTVMPDPDGTPYIYYYSDGNTPDGLGRPSIMRSVLEIRP